MATREPWDIFGEPNLPGPLLSPANEEREIVLPYKPRPIWKNIFHPALKKYKRAVIPAHRRFGKTHGMLMTEVTAAMNDEKISPRYAYVAPFRAQAKKIAWEWLKYYTSVIPGVQKNETDLFIELPTRHDGAAGARVYILGADNKESLRGLYWDGVVLDEYADIKPEVWEKIMMPSLVDRDGFGFIIGTPKGQNQFYEIWQAALKDNEKAKFEYREPTWFTAKYDVYESGIFTEAQIRDIKAGMTDIQFRQEFLVDFTASATEVVIPIDLIDKSIARNLSEKDVPENAPVILGVDIARFGDDRTVIFKRQGYYVEKPRIFTQLSVTEVADQIISAINFWHPDAVFVDSGNMGAGVIDILHDLHYGVVQEVNFGSSATAKDRYENKRAEMYFLLRDSMEKGLAIPNMPDLKKELSITEYRYSKRGRRIIQPKEEIKAMMGASPDLADALALTFAREVGPRVVPGFTSDGQLLMCNTHFTVLKESNLEFTF